MQRLIVSMNLTQIPDDLLLRYSITTEVLRASSYALHVAAVIAVSASPLLPTYFTTAVWNLSVLILRIGHLP